MYIQWYQVVSIGHLLNPKLALVKIKKNSPEIFPFWINDLINGLKDVMVYGQLNWMRNIQSTFSYF